MSAPDTPPPADRPVAGWRTIPAKRMAELQEELANVVPDDASGALSAIADLWEAEAHAQRAEVARLTEALAKPGKTLVGNEAGRYVAQRLREMAENNPEFRDGLLEIAGDLATVSAGSDEEIAYQKGRAEVTAQRDAALALAREYDREVGCGCKACLARRAKLDAITGGGA